MTFPDYNQTLEFLRSAIGRVESGDNYRARSRTSSASGRHQVLRSTWNNFGGYRSAADAPPAVQEEFFTRSMGNLLNRYGGNAELATVAWFQGPGVADRIERNPSLWWKRDANGLTTRDYVRKVFSQGFQPQKALNVDNYVLAVAVRAVAGLRGIDLTGRRVLVRDGRVLLESA